MSVRQLRWPLRLWRSARELDSLSRWAPRGTVQLDRVDCPPRLGNWRRSVAWYFPLGARGNKGFLEWQMAIGRRQLASAVVDVRQAVSGWRGSRWGCDALVAAIVEGEIAGSIVGVEMWLVAVAWAAGHVYIRLSLLSVRPWFDPAVLRGARWTSSPLCSVLVAAIGSSRSKTGPRKALTSNPWPTRARQWYDSLIELWLLLTLS